MSSTVGWILGYGIFSVLVKIAATCVAIIVYRKRRKKAKGLAFLHNAPEAKHEE